MSKRGNVGFVWRKKVNWRRMEILLIHHDGQKPALVLLMLMNLVSLLGLINLVEKMQVKV